MIPRFHPEFEMLNDLIAFLVSHPGLLLVVVFAAAAIEYVFPPFWGDTLMLAGCAVAGLDRGTLMLAFTAALLGSIIGSMSAWWMGRRFGQATLSVLRRSERARKLHAKAENLCRVHGSRVLALNRFLPGARAFFLPLAGMGNMSGRRVFVWSTVGNVLYCAMLAGVGAAVASNAKDAVTLQAQLRPVMTVAACVALTTLLVLGVRAAFRSRAAAAAAKV